MKEERMREYETIYVMRPEMDDKEAKEFMLSKKEMIEKLGGKNLKVTALGRKKLAWECQKETRGIFVHHLFLGKPGIVKEFDRALSIDDKILIRQSVLTKKDVDPSTVEVGEDMLIPPIFKERKEFSDRRSSSRGYLGDREFKEGDGGEDSHFHDYSRRTGDSNADYADDDSDIGFSNDDN